MRSLKLFALLTFLVITVLSSCRSDALLPGDVLVYVPENVTSVMAVNLDRLMDKAGFDEIKKMPIYRDFLDRVSKENTAFARILEEPEMAGIDLEQRLYVNVELDQPDRPGLVTMIFSLKDKEAFEKTLDNLELQYLPASQDPGLFQHHGTALLWNESVGILGIGQEETIQQRTEAYLTTPEEQSISRNDDLLGALSEDFDVMNWMSSKGFVDLFQIGDMGKMARYTAEDLKENYLHSYLHFDAGEMRAEMEYHLAGKLANDLALVMDNEIDTDFSEKFPHDNLFFFTNFGLRPKGINQLLIEYHIKGLSEEPFRKFGMTTDDLVNAFSGDVAMAVYQKNEAKFLNLPSFLMAMTIDSREHLDRMLMAAQDADLIYRLDTDRYQLLREVPADTTISRDDRVEVEMLIHDGLLYLSDQAEQIDRIAAGNFNTGGKLPQTMQELAAKNAMVALLDMDWMSQIEDDWESVPVETVVATGSRKKATVTAKLKNAETNSLRQFFEWMNNQYEKEQNRQLKSDDEKS